MHITASTRPLQVAEPRVRRSITPPLVDSVLVLEHYDGCVMIMISHCARRHMLKLNITGAHTQNPDYGVLRVETRIGGPYDRWDQGGMSGGVLHCKNMYT